MSTARLSRHAHYRIEVSLQDWPADACESHEFALKLPFAELRLHTQRRRLLGSNYVALWHKAAIDPVVWKVRKGSKRAFAAASTNDRPWHKA
jgi:hypothetical protein